MSRNVAMPRQFILASNAERTVYLDLLRQSLQDHPLSLIGYCLMSNHVHTGRDPTARRGSGQGIERRTRPVCLVLEWSACFERTCLARPILFLSAGCGTSVGSFAVHGAESGAGGDGGRGNAVGVVQRGGALRRSGAHFALAEQITPAI